MSYRNKPNSIPNLKGIVTLADAYGYSCKFLGNLYELSEARAISLRLFEDLLGFGQTSVILGNDIVLNEEKLNLLCDSLTNLALHLPVQYVTGKTFFREMMLWVNESVLIPRPETEELVQWVLDDLKTGQLNNVSPSIWDIGTGSGAIAISLAREWGSSVLFASDISNDALQVARSNGQNNHVNIRFFSHDILTDPLPEHKFDIVVSNPPYVMDAEKKLMQPNVLDNEPSLALFVPDDDPLVFYRAIALAAARVLKRGGALYFEINENLGQDTVSVVQSAGFSDVELKRDFLGKERFIKGVIG